MNNLRVVDQDGNRRDLEVDFIPRIGEAASPAARIAAAMPIVFAKTDGHIDLAALRNKGRKKAAVA